MAQKLSLSNLLSRMPLIYGEFSTVLSRHCCHFLFQKLAGEADVTAAETLKKTYDRARKQLAERPRAVEPGGQPRGKRAGNFRCSQRAKCRTVA